MPLNFVGVNIMQWMKQWYWKGDKSTKYIEKGSYFGCISHLMYTNVNFCLDCIPHPKMLYVVIIYQWNPWIRSFGEIRDDKMYMLCMPWESYNKVLRNSPWKIGRIIRNIEAQSRMGFSLHAQWIKFNHAKILEWLVVVLKEGVEEEAMASPKCTRVILNRIA